MEIRQTVSSLLLLLITALVLRKGRKCVSFSFLLFYVSFLYSSLLPSSA
jgi:hypothetical protein